MVKTVASSPMLPRGRRTKSSWEPFFDPDEKAEFPILEWDFTHNKAPAHVTFLATGLDSYVNAGGRAKFENVRFEKCDFSGVFDRSPGEIVFVGCTFFECDFGLTTWIRTKFTSCKFDKSSLTQTKWVECEFRACAWVDVGLSGNATDFVTCIITNPIALVGASYIRRVEQSDHKRAMDNERRHRATKSTIARSISRMLVNVGDEVAYYEAVCAETNTSIISRIFNSCFGLRFGDKIFHRARCALSIPVLWLEFFILNASGFLNAWGRSVARPIIVGLSLVLVFWGVYAFDGSTNGLSQSLRKSVDVTTLIGYTAHVDMSMSKKSNWTTAIHMILGLWWYVILVPTLVNRISRVR